MFGVRPEQVEVVVQRESVVHSLVQFADNAVLAQLGAPDMRLCIQYALTYPERLPCPAAELDLFAVGELHFARPDTETFPLLAFAREAAVRGGSLPAAMNGANEEAVGRFLRGEIRYTDLFDLVRLAAEKTRFRPSPTLSDIFDADAEAREFVRRR